jgi:5'-nucleotidase
MPDPRRKQPNLGKAEMRFLAPALVALLLAGCASAPPGPVTVQVLAIHGHLEPPRGGFRQPDPADPGKTLSTPAGGIAHLATAVRDAMAETPNSIFVAAGDLIGASPLISALAQDRPTVDLLSRIGLVASAVGNHEFDRGAAALLELQRQAGFQWLAASTVDTRTGRTLLPPYIVRRFDGIDVAFIGLTLAATPSIVAADGVAGLEFRDEARTVNALVPGLRARGIEAIVLLIHEGGFPAKGPNDCPALSGPITQIVPKLDRAVDVVISGHTHRAYNCRIDGRLLTSADRFGTVLSKIRLTLDPRTRDVIDAQAHNVIVATERFAPDPRIAAAVAAYAEQVRPLAERPVGRLASALSNETAPNGEMPAGRLIADAQLAATAAPEAGGAQVALMNPGGVRTALRPRADGALTYGDLFAAQPFYNNLVTMTLTGAELQALLERQWAGQPFPRVLQVSRGFGYAWDAAQPPGRRIVPGSLRLHGRAVAPDEALRVTVNSFLAGGGDLFDDFKAGRERRTGAMDIDALEAFVRGGAVVDETPRIQRMN